MAILQTIGAAISFGAFGATPFYYAWIDHEGPKRWTEYKAKSEARGEILDLVKLTERPAVAPARNFGAHPLLAELFNDPPPADPAIHALDTANIAGLGTRRTDHPGKHGWRVAAVRPLEMVIPEGVGFVEAEEHILQSLAPHQRMLRSIAAAAERPECLFPIDWSEGTRVKIPHFRAMQSAVKLFSYDASARLLTGDADGAFLSTTSILRIATHAESDPSLIGHLVTITLRAIGYQPLWEGLRARVWDDAELERLDQLLAKADIDGACVRTLRTERAFMVHTIFEIGSGELSAAGLIPLGSAMSLLPLLPQGLWHQNAIAVCELIDRCYLDAPKLPGCEIPLGNEALATELVEKWRSPFRPDRFLAVVSLPVFGSILPKSVQAEATVRLARIAIALERYHLANRKYPAELAALTPDFLDRLPVDPVTGDSFHYTLRADGRPAIWSVGLNKIDEGGRTKIRRHGDWAWQYSMPEDHTIEDFESRDPLPPLP